MPEETKKVWARIPVSLLTELGSQEETNLTEKIILGLQSLIYFGPPPEGGKRETAGDSPETRETAGDSPETNQRQPGDKTETNGDSPETKKFFLPEEITITLDPAFKESLKIFEKEMQEFKQMYFNQIMTMQGLVTNKLIQPAENKGYFINLWYALLNRK